MSRRRVRVPHGRRAVALAVLGLVAVLVAVALMTVARPTTTASATASLGSHVPLVVTAPGVLESRPGAVTATARGSGAVVLAVGRQSDVTAWVGSAARTTVTRLRTADALATRATPGDASVPDAAGSDLWVQQARGTGHVTLTHQRLPGAWTLLAAGSGSGSAPTSLTLSWQERSAPLWAVPLLVVGLLALVAGALPAVLARWGASAAEAAERVPVPSRRRSRAGDPS